MTKNNPNFQSQNTVKLNLQSEKNSPLLRQINRYITCAKQCIIITGASISYSGGIHGTLEKLQCKVCTNIYEFTLQYCEIFKQGKASKCPRCKKKENVQIKEGKHPHTIGQLEPTIILY
ncbi:24113_t:CDS:2, partial [Racocetra persica]